MGNITKYRPGDDITHSWQAVSGLPWDPFDSCAVHTQREVVCPKCEVIVIARSSPHILDLVVLFSAVLVQRSQLTLLPERQVWHKRTSNVFVRHADSPSRGRTLRLPSLHAIS